MKKIVIIGAHGMMGGELFRTFEKTDICIGVTRQEMDITDHDRTIAMIKTLAPQVVINAAGFTVVDLCEQEQEKAFAVNAQGAENVAIGCRESKAKCVYLSTDYVFDGKKNIPYDEEDIPHPLSVYGLSKLEGEKNVKEIAEDHLIIRTSWLFGGAGANFVKTIIKLSREKKELSIVNDQTGSPTYTRDLSQAISLAVKNDLKETLHIAGSGFCTWFEFARMILDLSGNALELVPITTSQSGRSAPRPHFSVLSCEKLKKKTGYTMPHWEDALERCLKTMNV